MIIALLILSLIILFIVVMGYILSGPAYKGPVTDHFNGREFINPGQVKVPNLGDVLKWLLNRKRSLWSNPVDTTTGAKPPSEVTSGIRVTFVNHSTFLIQVDGLNILTDPVWSERAGPFSWIGPKRKRPPGIQLEDLPPIDIVLLSHNHYDHLDVETLRQLTARHSPAIFTSLGIKAFLDRKGIPGPVDMDWWDERAFNDLTIQSVPAQHASARGMFDRNKTLWSGFAIRRKQGTIYFAADTGYNDRIFRQIRERCGPVDLAFIPVGAYNPVWFMSPVHCTPEEAVKIHQECGARKSIAMHFGTFALGDENPEEVLRDLDTAIREAGIPPESFQVLKEGEGEVF